MNHRGFQAATFAKFSGRSAGRLDRNCLTAVCTIANCSAVERVSSRNSVCVAPTRQRPLVTPAFRTYLTRTPMPSIRFSSSCKRSIFSIAIGDWDGRKPGKLVYVADTCHSSPGSRPDAREVSAGPGTIDLIRAMTELANAAPATPILVPVPPATAEMVTIPLAKLEMLQRLATAGELSSTVAHEFNNVLMTILNYANLGIKHNDQATRDKALQKILDGANRATKICQSVLSASRNGAAEGCDASEVVRDTLVLLSREAMKYRIMIETDLKEVPKTSVPRESLQRVLINLVTNARQAIGERGSIAIATAADATGGTKLTVRDDGPGIAPENLPKIFERFFTTKTPDGSGAGGTGLGLSMCRAVLESAGGKITVASAVGKGTMFTLILPAKR